MDAPFDLAVVCDDDPDIALAAKLIVALSCPETPRVLREAARKIFGQKTGIGTAADSTKHCRMAQRVGRWYLAVADPLDRCLGRWWGPTTGRAGIESSASAGDEVLEAAYRQPRP